MKDYREIRPEFTVDKFTDGQAPTANVNSFQKLVNFIPKKGRIETRLGIGELVHTPDTSGSQFDLEDSTPGDPVTVSAGDPADFATIQLIMPFNLPDQSSLITNIIGPNAYMSAVWSVNYSGGVTVWTDDKKEGLSCCMMSDDTAVNSGGCGNPAIPYGFRTANAFPGYMPGLVGDNCTAFMMSYWIYPHRDGAAAEVHFIFGNEGWGAGNQSLSFRHFDDDLQMAWNNQTGGNATEAIAAKIVANRWHFICGWQDFATGFRGLYHWDDTINAETFTANESPPSGDYFYPSSSYNTINGQMYWSPDAGVMRTDSSDAYHGLMDYITMWSKPMHIANTSNITLARWLKNLHAG
jgi:hypothetical protein